MESDSYTNKTVNFKTDFPIRLFYSNGNHYQPILNVNISERSFGTFSDKALDDYLAKAVSKLL
jgi:hypothetical protein